MLAVSAVFGGCFVLLRQLATRDRDVRTIYPITRRDVRCKRNLK
jgi:hypothetical protein